MIDCICKTKTEIFNLLAITFLVLILIISQPLKAKEVVDREQQLKANYLMHLVNYIIWPKQRDMDGYVKICIYGGHPIESYVKELEDKVVNSMTLRIALDVSMQTIDSCNIVFVGENQQKRFKHEKDDNMPKNVLIVGESYDYIHSGGMFSFCVNKNKVRVVINKKTVNQSNIKVSSKLLRVAEIIE